jgi:hypothetical protein
LPSALDLVCLAFGIQPKIVVSINNCCYNALHDFLSSDAIIITIVFRPRLTIRGSSPDIGHNVSYIFTYCGSTT